MFNDFDEHLRIWLRAACAKWGCVEPGSAYLTSVNERLPVGLRTLLFRGISDGLILPDGLYFHLKELPHKGPYQWFSNRNWHGGPHPNWEYFIHVAEYVRLHRIATALNLRLMFEDNAMDLTLYRDNTLLVCIEVKFDADTLESLIKGVQTYESGIDILAPDRGNDHLRKAKYIMKAQPQYFAGVAIGSRREYRVEYPADSNTFRLIRDVIPWA